MSNDALSAALGVDRANALWRFVRAALPSAELGIEAASADASFRNYWRLYGAGRPLLVMNAPPAHENVRPWVDVSLRLRDAGLHAPEVLSADVEQGFLLIEDLGTSLYLPALDLKSVDELYGHALDALEQMHRRVVVDGLPSYDAKRLQAELDLFPVWFVERHLGRAWGAAEQERWQTLCAKLVGSALEQPQTFVHRDYHSRNLLITERSPGIIDFQDAVVGPITYDLVSLLRDCYIAWAPEQVSDWVEGHRERLVRGAGLEVGRTRWRRWFDWIGVQRHLKVLGIFARLNYRDGKPGYLKDLPLVLHYVLSVAERYGELAPFAEWLDGLTAGVDLTRPRA